MDETRYIAAIEIGSSKVTGAVGTMSPNGVMTVLAVEKEDCNDIVRYGIIKNLGEVSNHVVRIIDKLNRNKAVSPRKISRFYVGLGGRSMKSLFSDVKILFPEPTEITENIIKRLKEDALTNAPTHNMEVVDVIPRSYMVDKMETSSPEGSIGRSISAVYDIITCRNELKQNLKRTLEDKAEKKVEGYIVTPLAVANLVLTDEEKTLGCMLVDFGAETTTVCIFRNGALNYYATLPLGGRNITRDITSLSVLEERAEEIKRSSCKAVKDVQNSLNICGIKLSDVNNLVVARAEEIVANVIQQVTYAGLKDKDLPGGIICVGGATNLGNMTDLIEKQSGMKVRKAQLPAGFELEDPRARRFEALQVVSLLYAAAQEGGPNCLEYHYDDYDSENPYEPEYGPEDIDEQEDPVPPVSGRRKLMDRFRNKISRIFAPPEEEDEQELE